MTPKESAKVIFGVLHDDWFSWTPEVVEAFNMAISALEKQEPMKPLQQEMDIDGRAITPCGFCGEELPHNPLYDFCPYCGQAIDRRDRNDR